MFPLFATGAVYTGGELAAGVVDTGGNLPRALLTMVAASTTLAKLVEKFAAGVINTRGAR